MQRLTEMESSKDLSVKLWLEANSLVPLRKVLHEESKKAEVHVKNCRDETWLPKLWIWSKTSQEANIDKTQKNSVLRREHNRRKAQKLSIPDMTLSLTNMTNKVTHTKTPWKFPSGFNYSY